MPLDKKAIDQHHNFLCPYDLLISFQFWSDKDLRVVIVKAHDLSILPALPIILIILFMILQILYSPTLNFLKKIFFLDMTMTAALESVIVVRLHMH